MAEDPITMSQSPLTAVETTRQLREGLISAEELVTVCLDRIAAVKSHNPFAVNDVFFARETGFDIGQMNNFGCSLIWGHPQGPTGTRSVIELIEELALRGGGNGLFHGCAAGDSAMAVVLCVDVK